MRSKQPFRRPRLLLPLWIAGCAILLGVATVPLNHGVLRLLLAIGVPTLWLLALAGLRARKPLALAGLALGLALATFALLPGRPLPPGVLRAEYVAQLAPYEGVRYRWGGENRFGIDCSGLVRRALVRAHLKLAFTQPNPSSLRTALDLWWHDCSARALRDSYRGFTIPLLQSPSILSLDPAILMPGDLAVTSDGIHVLAYLGDRRWIEADPSAGRVLVVSTPTDNPWFGVPVTILSWKGMGQTVHTGRLAIQL